MDSKFLKRRRKTRVEEIRREVYREQNGAINDLNSYEQIKIQFTNKHSAL